MGVCLDGNDEERCCWMDKDVIVPEFSVEDTLRRWPQTIPVFLKYRMGCVGCTMGAYESLSSAASIYKLPLKSFIRELQKAVEEND
jgi:hybrid cluster-associated redox disulfide protein